MKKYRVIIDMINDFLAFWPDYCIYIGAISSTTLSQPRLPTEIAAVRIEKNITPQKMMKRRSKKDMTNFLQTPNKLFSKKRRQINKNKRKASLEKTSLKKAIISSLDSFDKKKSPASIPATIRLKLKAKNIDIAIIGANTYCIACCLKRAQVFAVFIRDIQYQAEKKARAETNLKKCCISRISQFS